MGFTKNDYYVYNPNAIYKEPLFWLMAHRAVGVAVLVVEIARGVHARFPMIFYSSL